MTINVALKIKGVNKEFADDFMQKLRESNGSNVRLGDLLTDIILMQNIKQDVTALNVNRDIENSKAILWDLGEGFFTKKEDKLFGIDVDLIPDELDRDRETGL